MGIEEKIPRINELYHKQQSVGLTPEELEEQKLLRAEYIAAVRRSLTGQLDNVDLQNPDGTITHLKERAARNRKNRRTH